MARTYHTYDRPGKLLLVAMLFVSVAGISSAAPVIKLCRAPFLAIAFWRMFLGTLAVGSIWLVEGKSRETLYSIGIPKKIIPLSVSGFFLGLHFALWIASLSHTSVAASVVLVNTQPVFTAVIVTVFLKERPGKKLISGILIATAGAVVLGAGEAGEGTRLLGCVLAVLGAICASLYYSIGRAERKEMGLWAYVTIVYAFAAGTLLLLAWFSGTRLIYWLEKEWLFYILLAVLPTLFGHTILNWSLRWLPAPFVNTVALCEPFGAALISALLPQIREIPGPLTILGGVIIVAGIFWGQGELEKG